MERTTDKGSVKITWQKTGGGSLRLVDPVTGKKRIIKPGQKFKAALNEIPEAFRDIVIPMESVPGSAPPPVIKAEDLNYTRQPRGNSKTWFDVVNKDGKVLNEKALTKEKADKLISDLLK